MPVTLEQLQRRRDELSQEPAGTPSPPASPMAEALRRRHAELETARGAPPAPPAAQPRGAAAIPAMAAQRFLQRDVPPGQDTALEASRATAVGILAMLGATAGARIPIAPGPAGIVVNPLTGTLALGAAGAAAGTFAPEFTLETLERFGLVEPGTAERLGRPMSERLRMAQGEVALDATLGVGAQIPRLVMARPMARVTTGPKKVGPGGIVGQTLAESAHRELGITLMPWQVGGRSVARAALAVAGRFPWVGAPARKMVTGGPIRFTTGQELAEQQALAVMQELPHRAGGRVRKPYDLSHAILEDALDLHGRYKAYFERQYRALWDAADANNVRVRLDHVSGAGRGIIKDIEERAATVGGVPDIQQSHREAIEFIQGTILGRDRVQSLRGLDTIIDEIDNMFLRVEPRGPEQNRFLLGKLNELRNAALRDMTESVVDLPPAPGAVGGPPTTTRVTPGMEGQAGRVPPPGGPTTGAIQTGPGQFQAVTAQEIARRLRELDQEFSAVVSGIFETSTAKRFARVERRGLRGMTWDPTTTTPIGKLASITLDLEDPKAVQELFQLIRPQTQKDLVASVLEEGLSQSWRTAETGFGSQGLKFDTDHFLDYFGLSPGKGARGDALREMLKQADVSVSMDTVWLLGRTLDALSLTAIPSASTFMARRAQIGGGRAVIAGMLGGLVGAGGAGYTAAGIKGSVIGMIISFAGARGFVRAISNPAGARALKNVLREEADLGTMRANALRLARAAGNVWVEAARKEVGDVEAVRDMDAMRKEFEEGLDQELRGIQRGLRRQRGEPKPPLAR